MVLGLTSRTDTPPVVTMASAIGRLPEISTGKHLSTRSSEARCFLRDGVHLFARIDAAFFDDRRDELARQQLAERVDEVAVLVLVEVGEQTPVERFPRRAPA